MSLVRADYYIHSLEHIDLDMLEKGGIRAIFLDRDNTCVSRCDMQVPDFARSWISEARKRGFKLCIISNNFHGTQVQASAKELNIDALSHALKPLPHMLLKACRNLELKPHQVVMVGDQVFTDVVAAKLAGMSSILVRPLCRVDLWYTHIFRIFENLVLKGVHFLGE